MNRATLLNVAVFLAAIVVIVVTAPRRSDAPAPAATPEDVRTAVAVASTHQTGFDVRNINDGTEAPWGSAEEATDVYAGVDFGRPLGVSKLTIRLFAREGQGHLRDVRVVVADRDEGGHPAWVVVRSKLSEASNFTERVTIPPLGDGSTVTLQIDPGDQRFGTHRFWGIACLAASQNDRRNYLASGLGVYFRELELQ